MRTLDPLKQELQVTHPEAVNHGDDDLPRINTSKVQ